MRRMGFAWALAALSLGILQAAAEGPSGDLDAVWVAPGSATQGEYLSMSVDLHPDYPGNAPITFPFEISGRSNHGGAKLMLSLRDAAGQAVQEVALGLNLRRGHNQCALALNPSELPSGEYALEFRLDYAPDTSPAVITAHLERVRGTSFIQAVDTYAAQFADLTKRLALVEAEGRKLPQLRIKLAVAARALAQAHAARDAGDWSRLAGLHRYLRWTVGRANADLILANYAPESQLAVAPAESVTVRNGELYADGRAYFGFGAALNGPGADSIGMLKELGLNFASVPLTAKDTLPSKESKAAFEGAYDTFFDAAAQGRVRVVVRLGAQATPPWVLDAHPAAFERGMTNVADPGLRALLERHLDAALPYLAGKPAVQGISLVDRPEFHFDGESIRQRFIEHVKTLYPERMDLTRKWRAHLAKFDEIAIWDKKQPYLALAPYQYDWQTFHRGLGTQYFQWARDAAAKRGAKAPVFVTLPDTLFDVGETRNGVDRDAVAGMMDASACASRTSAESKRYAIDFPKQSALYTLLRSTAPTKPVYDLEDNIELAEGLAPDRAFRSVYAMLWEGAISGVNAMAVPESSKIFAQPGALEGFAAAAADINRLGDAVVAFQQAPADIGILFSATSKIYDDGTPHLSSALRAFEGVSFGGYNARFITEPQIQAGGLDHIKLLMLPETPAVTNETFKRIAQYADRGGVIARPGTPIPYNERGESRKDVIRNTEKTLLLHEAAFSTAYLHAIDAAVDRNALPSIPRPVNAYGYPLEGVRTRFVQFQGEPYMYIVNLRKSAVDVHLTGNMLEGRDVIHGQDMAFPRVLEPLDPMLIRLSRAGLSAEAHPAKRPEDMTRRERREARREARAEEERR